MLFRSSIPLLFALLLAACATPTDLARAPAEPQEDAAPQETGWRQEDLPKVNLTADLLIRFLAGDIAIQRGQAPLAAQSWFDAAQRTRDPRVARRAAELGLATGQITLTQDATRIWSETAPTSHVPRVLMITLFIRANRLSEIEPSIPAFLLAPPATLADFYMQLHNIWDRKAEPEAVARLTLSLTAGKEAMPEAHFARAVTHAAQARAPQALASLDEALRLRPWWEQAVLYKAQLLAQQPSPDAAIALLRQAITQSPMQTTYPLALARILNEARRQDEARAAYQDVLARQPALFEALVGAGLLALQARDFDNAYRLLSDAVTNEKTRNTSSLRHYLGQIEEERNHPAEALRWYRQVTGEEKTKALRRIPRILAKLGNQAAAIKALDEIPAGSDAEKIEKIQMESQIWRELKNLATARSVLDQGLVLYPDADDLYYDRAMMADQAGNLAVAEADLRRVLKKQPDYTAALNALGYILANRTDRLHEAEALLNQAIAQEPDNPVIIDSMGWLRFRQGRMKEAVEWLGRAYRLMPDPEIAAHFAEALWNSGDKAKARSVLEEALKREPTQEDLLATYKRLGF